MFGLSDMFVNNNKEKRVFNTINQTSKEYLGQVHRIENTE